MSSSPASPGSSSNPHIPDGGMGSDPAFNDAGSPVTSGSASAQAAAAAGSSSNVEGSEILNRVVQGAHETVDRIAAAAAPHAQRLGETLRSAGGNWEERTDHLHEMGDEWVDSLRQTVRDNPLAAIAVALAAGLLVARLAA